MNKVFKVIWNHATQTWTAVSEISHAHGKKSASDKRKAVAAAVAAAGALMASGSAIASMDLTTNGAVNIAPDDVTNPTAGLRAVAVGTNANASKDHAVAIGTSTNASGVQSVTVGSFSNATAESVVAIGQNSNAGGTGGGTAAVAVGYLANASGANTVATGKSAAASVDNAVAVGVQSNASARAATALGGYSAASAERATAVGAASKATGTASFAGGTSANAAGVNSVAVGGSMTAAEAAQAAGANSIAVGSKSNAQQAADVAVGHGATANGTSSGTNAEGSVSNAGSAMAIGTEAQATGIVATAIGQRSQALANGAVALGGDAQAKQGSDVAIGRGSVADGISASAFGPAAQATGKYAVALGVQSNAASEQAIALGRLSQASGNFATALGNGAQATAQNTLALGTSAQSTIENSVALGNGSTTSAFAPTNSATVGKYTYGGFAGATSGLGNGAVLSVGSAGNERQIQNVAAGRISATSTDAINGSQLHATQAVIGNLASTTASHLGGTVSVGADGKLTTPVYNVAGNTYNNVGAALEALDGAITGNKTHYYSVYGIQQTAGSNYNNDGATGTHALAAGVFAQATANDATAVGGKMAKALASQALAVGSDTKAEGVSSIAIGGDDLRFLQQASIDYYKTLTGDTGFHQNVFIDTHAKGEAAIAMGVQARAKGDLSMTLGVKSETEAKGAVALGTGAKGNAEGAVALGAGSVADRAALAAAATTSPTATVAAGNVYANANASNAAKAAVSATVKQVAGAPLGAVSVGNADNTRQITHVAAGTEDSDAVNVAQLKAVAEATATTPLTVADGKVTSPAAADANKLATAGDIANAINNSGFNIDAGGNVTGNHTATLAKPGSTLTLKAGYGLTVKQDVDTNGDQTYTYALDAQTVVQNAQTPVVYTKDNGDKVYKHTDGNFYTQPNGAGTQVPAGDVIASMQDAAGSTTAPTTLANVKSNLADTATAVTNPTGNKRTDLAGKGNNAATVNDVLNSGFTVQGNGQNKDFVTHGDTINFANGQGTVANVTSKNGVTTVKFDTPMTYADASGNPTSTPSNKVNLVGGDATKPVTLGNVADGTVAAGSKEAVNGGQLHATNQNVANNTTNIAKGINFGGTTGSKNYRLGDTINVKGDSNITSTTVAGGAQLALNPNLNVTSVTTTDAAGNKTVTNGSGVTITPASGNPVSLTTGGLNNGGNKITNVAEGTAGTDAVNVGQLKAAKAAATTKVKAGNGISVNGTQNADGSTTYTVAADTTPLTVANGKVTSPAAADANKLATAGDIANAINNSGFQATAGGNLVSGTNATPTTVKPGQKVTFAAGNGLTVKQEIDNASGNQTYTYALDAQSVVQNAQAPVVYTKADGTKVYKRPDGKFYDASTGGNEVPAGDVIASMQDAAGSTTAPTTLANVKSNLADTAAAVTNPAGNSRADLAGKGNNAATVNDVLNSGFTVQGNGQNKDFVTHGDTINFANGQGTVANVTSTNGVTTVKFDTPMTYADASGNPTSTPSNKVNLVGGDATKPVTLGNVADGTVAAGSKEAVNGGQLHATNQNVANNTTNIAKGINFGGTTGSKNYRLGDTINVKGDSNITSTTVAGGAQLALNPNLNVTSVTTTDAAGNKTVTNGSGVTITPASGNPVSLTTGGLNNGGNKITNVAEGTDGTDAVNVSQLKQAIGAIAGPNTANFTALNNKVNEVAADAKAGTAAAMAVAGLPQAYLPGKSMMAVGGSVYRGESGYAIGYSTISDGGNWIIKGTATGNSRGHYGATAAVGYQW